MKELTKAEEQIMQVLWQLKKGFINDILEKLPLPRPAYNTVSTIVRILEKKGFVKHKAYGKTHEYYPVVSKEVYKKGLLKSVVKNYFDDSALQLVSFFTREKSVSLTDIDEIMAMIADEKKKKSK